MGCRDRPPTSSKSPLNNNNVGRVASWAVTFENLLEDEDGVRAFTVRRFSLFSWFINVIKFMFEARAVNFTDCATNEKCLYLVNLFELVFQICLKC